MCQVARLNKTVAARMRLQSKVRDPPVSRSLIRNLCQRAAVDDEIAKLAADRRMQVEQIAEVRSIDKHAIVQPRLNGAALQRAARHAASKVRKEMEEKMEAHVSEESTSHHKVCTQLSAGEW